MWPVALAERGFRMLQEPRHSFQQHEVLSPMFLSGFVWFAPKSHCVVLCFGHGSTSLAWSEFIFISSRKTFNFILFYDDDDDVMLVTTQYVISF